MSKCPVCKSEQQDTISTCTVCGFNQLNRIFVSEADAAQWINSVVLTCRSVWVHTQSQLESALEEAEKYRALYIEKLQENIDLLEEHKTLLELQAAYFADNTNRPLSESVEAFLAEADDDDELPF